MKAFMLLPILLCTGCFGSVRIPSVTISQAAPAVESALILERWGVYCSWAGGALITLAVITLVCSLWFKFPPPKWAGFFGMLGVFLVVSGQLFIWLQANLKPLAIVTLAAACVYGAWFLYKHLRRVEEVLDVDLNRDGQVG